MYCISCKKNCVEPIDSMNYRKPQKDEEDILWYKKVREGKLDTINNSIVDGGIIHIIDGGFGSRYDGSQVIIAICDDCIKDNLEDSTILYFGDYMDQDLSNSKIEESKSRYRRRKNLDKLTED